MQRYSLVSKYNALVLGLFSFIMLDQRQPRCPTISVYLKLPYPVVWCSPNAEVLYFVPHSVVIRVIPRTMEQYRVYQPLFIRIGLCMLLPILEASSCVWCISGAPHQPMLYSPYVWQTSPSNHPIPIQHQYFPPWSKLGRIWRSSPHFLVLTRSTQVVTVFRRCI